jgi:hypothetical protein
MLLLTTTSDKIQLVTTQAVATHVQASWMDNNAGTITPGRLNTIVSTAATSDIVGVPGGSTSRNVKHISVRAVGGQQGVTIQHTDGTNVVQLINITLQTGELLVFNDGQGFQVFNSQGNLKVGNGITGAFTIVNVMDYGAKGDGSTNDAAAIQAAINAAGAMGVSGRGVDVVFPSGVYAIGSTIAVPFNNVILRGSGWQSTVLYATFTTGDILQLGNGTTKSGCGLMNMSVWCNAARTTGASININAMNDCLVQNFVINNCFTGILVQGVSIKVWIDQGEINNIHAADGLGISVINGAAGDTYIRAVIMSNSPASKPLSGIDIQQTGHLEIINCNITSCVKGLYVHPTGTQLVNYLFIEHTLFDSCGSHGAHFYASGAATAKIQSVVAIDSWFSGTAIAGSGIEFGVLNSAIEDALSFIGCRILNNYNAGVTLGAGPVNISFTDCTFAGNGQQTTNTYNAIEIAAAASSILIEGCKIGQAGTAGNQQKYAINWVAGASANVIIINNDCQPNGTVGNRGYIQIGAITGGGNIIKDNNPSVPGSFSTARVAATGAITTTETLVTDATAQRNRLMANALIAGTHLRFTIIGTYTVSTGAGTWNAYVLFGTNNSTADTKVLSLGSQTTGATLQTGQFKIVIDITIRTLTTCYGWFDIWEHNSPTAGAGLIATKQHSLVAGTPAAITATQANYINASILGSANCSITVQSCTMETIAP